MGREVEGSAFESGDDENRTWDEMGLGEELYEPDDSDADEDDDAYEEIDDYEPMSLEDWRSGWAEADSPDIQRRLLKNLDEQIADLAERIRYRDMAAMAGQPIDAGAAEDDRREHRDLTAFRESHPDPPPAPTSVAAPEPMPSETAPPAANPFRLREAAIKAELSDAELLHWQELQKGTRQAAIAKKLGISQGAVSKRERILRERVDAISVRTTGHPYSEKLIDRGLWARQGRRRNKRAPDPQ
jgi:hypothetical protein